MVIEAEKFIAKYKQGRVSREVKIVDQIVTLTYRNRKGISYDILLDLEVWNQIKDYNIFVNVIGSGDKKCLSATIKYLGEVYSLSRFIMNPPENMVVDHIDWNRLNNLQENLRICSQEENLQNLQPTIRNSMTGIKWSPSHKKWLVTYLYSTVTRQSGLFDTLELAIVARDNYRAQYLPFSLEARES